MCHSDTLMQFESVLKSELSNYLNIWHGTRNNSRCFSYRVAVVERVTELLQSVEVLDVVFSLVGRVRYPGVQLLPRLEARERCKQGELLRCGMI